MTSTTASTELRARQDKGRKAAQNKEKWAQARTYISAAVILIWCLAPAYWMVVTALLGAGFWSRDAHELYTVPRQIQAGRVWVNCYHDYPAHAPFGGYKKSGFGRENHLMMLNHYRQVKNLLISYSQEKLGFF